MLKKTEQQSWRPSATHSALCRRAQCLRQIRNYFFAEGVLEVDTPLLMPWGSTDPSLSNFFVESGDGVEPKLRGYLQTSPEFAMKRLLAAGSGDIYQLGRAFRAEQPSRHHLPEFVLLEWYRLGYNDHRLMDDVQALVACVVPGLSFTRRRYADVFFEAFNIDPHEASLAALMSCATNAGIELGQSASDRSLILEALFSSLFLRPDRAGDALFVYDFPVEQAAYARIAAGPPAVAQRFELIVGGLEIANGYFEVVEYTEQMDRHNEEKSRRDRLGLPFVELDPRFIEAMQAGLPDCSGVALGVDRLLMLGSMAESIQDTTSFNPYEEYGIGRNG